MKILWVAPSFPPVNVSSSIRLLNYVNMAVQLGHECDVVTIDYPMDHDRRDDVLLQQVEGKVRIFRYSPGFLYLKGYPRNKPLNSQSSIDGSRKVKKIIRDFITKYIAVPDSLFESIPRAIKLVNKLTSQNYYDIVFSAHEPPSSHIITYFALKDQNTIRWLAYWSDPWTGENKRKNLPWLRQWIEKQIEKRVVRRADKLMFTSLQTMEQYLNIFSIDSAKCAIAYRGYDESQINRLLSSHPPKHMLPNKIPIVYSGSIFKGLRNLDPFIEAITEVATEQHDFINKVHFYFIGDISNTATKIKLDKLNFVTTTGLLPHDEAMRYVAHAKLLLFMGNHNSTQIPGKIYEYFGVAAPIFSIVDNFSDPSIDLLKKVNKGPIVENEKAKIKQLIVNTINLIQDNRVPEPWLKCVQEYSWDNVVKKLLKDMMT